jgi:glycosyltransferase involved in cell wall biosynthesis
MEPILVSAIIPAYNAELYLAKAIESALAQTFRNFEIIVVNDGSTDNTAQIAHQFKDDVQYVYQSNQGLAAARNTGIRHAKSQIIALLDADDLWDPEFLQVMVELFEKHPDAAAVYCGFKYIDAQGNIVGKPSLRVVSPELFHRTQVMQGNWLSACAVLFRKSIAEEVGLFDESLRALEDQDLWIRLSANHAFIGVPVPLVKYRQHGSNMSKDPRHMITADEKLMEKVFGSWDNNISSWPKVKVIAYGNHFRSAAVRYLAAGNYEKSTYYLCRLAEVSLDFLCSIDLWRALARAHMPDEYQFDDLVEPDWDKMQKDVDILLAELNKLRVEQANINQNYARIKSSAFLALADEAGRCNEPVRAGKWLMMTVRVNLRMFFMRPFWGTMYRSISISIKSLSRMERQG